MLTSNILSAIVAVTDTAYQMRLASKHFTATHEGIEPESVLSALLNPEGFAEAGVCTLSVLDEDFASFIRAFADYDNTSATQLVAVAVLREVLTRKGTRASAVSVLVDIQTRAASVDSERFATLLPAVPPVRRNALIDSTCVLSVSSLAIACYVDALIGGSATVVEAIEALDVELLEIIAECPIMLWTLGLSKDHITALNRIASHMSNLADSSTPSAVTCRSIGEGYASTCCTQEH